jgi:hypothetical protein
LEVASRLTSSYVIQSPLTPRQYRKLVSQSKYVISPPGNGPDCHRTWEALYLGATPIVKRSHWPFNKYKLPVAIVDSWDEIAEPDWKESLDIPKFGFPWQSISAWLEEPLVGAT